MDASLGNIRTNKTPRKPFAKRPEGHPKKRGIVDSRTSPEARSQEPPNSPNPHPKPPTKASPSPPKTSMQPHNLP